MTDHSKRIRVALGLICAAALAQVEDVGADDTIQGGGSKAQKALTPLISGPGAQPLQPLSAFLNGVGAAPSIATQQLTTQSDIQVNTTAVASAAESARGVRCLGALRTGVQQPGCENLLQGQPATTGGLNEPFGISVTGRFGSGKLDSVGGQTGFDSDMQNFTALFDYRFSNQLVAGISVGYQHTKLDFDLNSGNLKNDAYRIAPYVNFALGDKGYIDAMIGYGWLSFDSERVCSSCSTGSTGGVIPVSTASYNGSEYLASLGGGYDFGSGPWALRGYARGDYVRVSPDAYTESSNVTVGTNPALHVDSQSATSLTSVLGVEIGRVFGTSAGVFTPRVRVEWVHEFKDDPRSLNSQFVSPSAYNGGSVIPGTVASFQTTEPTRDWANLGVGLQMGFAHSLSAFVDYEHLFKQDASNDIFSIGVRYQF